MNGNFGTYLREKRSSAGLTQKQLAKKVGVSTTYINQLETKKVNAPTREMCQKLAPALGISFLALWRIAKEERLSQFATREGLEDLITMANPSLDVQDLKLITDPNFGKIYYELQGANDLSEKDKRQLSDILLGIIRSYIESSNL